MENLFRVQLMDPAFKFFINTSTKPVFEIQNSAELRISHCNSSELLCPILATVLTVNVENLNSKC